MAKGGFAATGFTDDGDRFPAPGLEVERFVRFHVADAFTGDHCLQRAVDDFVVLLHVIDGQHRLAELDRIVADANRDGVLGLDVGPAFATHAMHRVVIRRDFLHTDGIAVALPFQEEIAARAEVTTLRAFVRQRQLSADGDQRPCVLVGVGQGNAAEQAMRVGMLWPREYGVDGAFLDRLTRIHHADAVADLEHQAEIVGDIEQGGSEILAQLADETDDASLDGDVEGSRRFVEQQQ